MSDQINSPKHYSQGGEFECIDALEALGIAEDYCRGNALKYLWRMNDKGQTLADVKKAQWYVNRLVGYVEAEYAATNPRAELDEQSDPKDAPQPLPPSVPSPPSHPRCTRREGYGEVVSTEVRGAETACPCEG